MAMKSGWNFPRPANGSGQAHGYARGGAVKMPHAPKPAAKAAPRVAPAPIMRPMAPTMRPMAPPPAPMAPPLSAAPPPPGMAHGGKVTEHHHHHIMHGKSDVMQDRDMITRAVHEHEEHDHPHEPLTNLHFAQGGHVAGMQPPEGAADPHHTGAMTETHLHHHYVHEAPADGRGGHEPTAGHSDGYAEGGKFIQGMHLKKGALHRQLHIPEGKKIPEKRLEQATHSNNPLLAKRAHTAQMLKGLPHKGGKKK